MAIESIAATTISTLQPRPAGIATNTSGGFGESLRQVVSAVEDSQSKANNAVADMLNGQGEVHDAMIALQQADLTFQLTLQMRNKFVQAYQDVMRMPI